MNAAMFVGAAATHILLICMVWSGVSFRDDNLMADIVDEAWTEEIDPLREQAWDDTQHANKEARPPRLSNRAISFRIVTYNMRNYEDHWALRFPRIVSLIQACLPILRLAPGGMVLDYRWPCSTVNHKHNPNLKRKPIPDLTLSCFTKALKRRCGRLPRTQKEHIAESGHTFTLTLTLALLRHLPYLALTLTLTLTLPRPLARRTTCASVVDLIRSRFLLASSWVFSDLMCIP